MRPTPPNEDTKPDKTPEQLPEQRIPKPSELPAARRHGPPVVEQAGREDAPS